MYFVTDEPKLFNTETGCIFKVRGEYDDCCQVEVTGSASFYQPVFEGTRQECADFIYSIAGYVGAVNPAGTNQNKELVNFVKAARDIIDSGPMVSIDNELADDMVETANRILDGIA